MLFGGLMRLCCPKIDDTGKLVIPAHESGGNLRDWSLGCCWSWLVSQMLSGIVEILVVACWNDWEPCGLPSAVSGLEIAESLESRD